MFETSTILLGAGPKISLRRARMGGPRPEISNTARDGSESKFGIPDATTTENYFVLKLIYNPALPIGHLKVHISPS